MSPPDWAFAGGLQALGGTALAAGACLFTARSAAPIWRHPLALILELLLPLLSLMLLLALSARPLFSGVTTLLLGAAYRYADCAKQSVLAEPIVYTDVFQALDIFRHPQLALPFPRLLPILLGVTAGLAFFAIWFVLEPPMWPRSWLQLLLVLALPPVVVMLLLAPLRAPVVALLRRAGLAGELQADRQGFGSLGLLLTYAFMARVERRARQAQQPPVSVPTRLRPARPEAGPLVLVQAESFFDARRLHPAVDAQLLPAWDRLRAGGAQHGRLSVPSWGANTVRTEFGVLTGLAPSALGYDRFNPYHRFARAPINSLAWRMRALGHRTICLHPFDRRFYGRDRVLPNLGFDTFIGEEAFAGAERVNGFVSDRAIARRAMQILEDEGPYVFLFIITMENHGPWPAMDQTGLEALDFAPDLPLATRRSLARYLRSLRHADELLATLSAGIDGSPVPGVLGFYGDHLPAFGQAFELLGMRDLRSDYLIYHDAQRESPRRDIEAHELHEAVFQAWAGLLPARMRQEWTTEAMLAGAVRGVQA
ncbi:Sulfatase [Solimonas aquatica]|uniref:Sulfatase n=1 Tax=Solimonas aquatica TaxID=489703 RepID=A0A1H9CJV6_9GAMM|nr:LTA synthase family protein [Solimonas aquatica]SEQ01482.1 Sulfatase [Solimonas aquatica]